jgi:hypothetical protein
MLIVVLLPALQRVLDVRRFGAYVRFDLPVGTQETKAFTFVDTHSQVVYSDLLRHTVDTLSTD